MIKRYLWGFLKLWTQAFGWTTQYTWSTAMTTSAAGWVKRDWVYRAINWTFEKFGQPHHCEIAVLGNIQECRNFLESEGIGHLVLNQEQAAEYLELVASRDAVRKSFSKWAEPTPVPASNNPLIVKRDPWVWTDADYINWISAPVKFEDKRRFYNAIKEGGFNPQGVPVMSRTEYDHWSEKARKFAMQWVAQHDTPKPADHHGMTE